MVTNPDVELCVVNLFSFVFRGACEVDRGLEKSTGGFGPISHASVEIPNLLKYRHRDAGNTWVFVPASVHRLVAVRA